MLNKIIGFGIVGLISTFTHVFILVGLVELFQVTPVWATIYGFFASLLVSYSLNQRWVFVSGATHYKTFPRYVLTTGIGLFINVSIMYWVVDYLQWQYMTGMIMVILIVPATNFILANYWVFGHQNLPEKQ